MVWEKQIDNKTEKLKKLCESAYVIDYNKTMSRCFFYNLTSNIKLGVYFRDDEDFGDLYIDEQNNCFVIFENNKIQFITFYDIPFEVIDKESPNNFHKIYNSFIDYLDKNNIEYNDKKL